MARHGKARRGEVGLGTARLGMAWPGEAWQGLARRGREYFIKRRGLIWLKLKSRLDELGETWKEIYGAKEGQ